MPRDGSGVYTLPAGNPVVSNTTILSTWANPTMSDIAAQLNNVLTRDGTLGLTGPFKLQDGAVGAPALSWNSEPGLGWFRPGAGLRGFAESGSEVEHLDASSTATTTFSILARPGGQKVGLQASAAGGTVFSLDAASAGLPLILSGNPVSLLNGQLQFPAAQNPSTNPNVLDDYEEGTWNPTNQAGAPMTVIFATYVKIGRLVFLECQLNIGNNSNGQQVILYGMPFPMANFSCTFAIGAASYIGSPPHDFMMHAVNSQGYISMQDGNIPATWQTFALGSIYFSGFYLSTT